MKKVLMLSLFSLCGFLVFTYFQKSEKASQLPKISQIKDFELINQENERYGLKDLKGSFWIASFIFTRCQGPCPLITKKMQSIVEQFSGFSNVKFISVSMDPDYDKPDVFLEYAEKHHLDLKSWNFLTGDRKAVMDITRNLFRLPVSEDPEMHTTRIVLVDPDANIRAYYNSLDDESVNKLIVDIKNFMSPGV